jgi:hypothetical protein
MVRASAVESFKVLRVLSSVRLRGYERRSRLCGKFAQLPLVGQHLHVKQAKSKEINKQTNKQAGARDRTENLRGLEGPSVLRVLNKERGLRMLEGEGHLSIPFLGTQSTHAGRTVSRSAAVAAVVSLDSAATFASDARMSTSAVNRQFPVATTRPAEA